MNQSKVVGKYISKKEHVNEIGAAEKRMLRWIFGKTRKDKTNKSARR